MRSKEYRDNFRRTLLLQYAEIYGNSEICAFHPEFDNILVSSLGRVQNTNTNHIYTPMVNTQGYLNVGIYPTGSNRSVSKLVHRLVAETFFAYLTCKHYEVNHINGNKADNSIYNIEWLTRQENLQHARDTGLFKQQFGRTNGRYKYLDQDIEDMIELHNLGYTYREISKAYGLAGTGIFKVIKRRKEQ